MHLNIASVVTIFFLSWSSIAASQTWVNTIGSPEGIAIQGYDSVAFFTEKKAVSGSKEYSVEWAGATWLFSTQENLALFKQDPDKWSPQYGGHCSYGISEGYISKKPTSGQFALRDDKLYLFPKGTKTQTGAYDGWWQSGGGPSYRIAEGAKKWPQLKASLEVTEK